MNDFVLGLISLMLVWMAITEWRVSTLYDKYRAALRAAKKGKDNTHA